MTSPKEYFENLNSESDWNFDSEWLSWLERTQTEFGQYVANVDNNEDLANLSRLQTNRIYNWLRIKLNNDSTLTEF